MTNGQMSRRVFVVCTFVSVQGEKRIEIAATNEKFGQGIPRIYFSYSLLQYVVNERKGGELLKNIERNVSKGKQPIFIRLEKNGTTC